MKRLYLDARRVGVLVLVEGPPAGLGFADLRIGWPLSELQPRLAIAIEVNPPADDGPVVHVTPRSRELLWATGCSHLQQCVYRHSRPGTWPNRAIHVRGTHTDAQVKVVYLPATLDKAGR